MISKKITESFNNFFCNIGKTSANKFVNNNIEDYQKYLNNPVDHSLLLYRIKQNEIKDAICNLINNNSSGYNEITTKFVKLSSPIFISNKIPQTRVVYQIYIKKHLDKRYWMHVK